MSRLGLYIGNQNDFDQSMSDCIFLLLFLILQKSTSNYHARRFGVRAAMPGFIAKKLCPNLIIVPTNFKKYRAVSDEVSSRAKHINNPILILCS